MIKVTHLTKRFGTGLAVDDVTFAVAPGQVTGFLGPNGAGKSTTMRMIVGLDRPTSGRATVDGRAYARLASPLRSVGVLLETGSMHPGRSVQAHLAVLAATHRIPRRRVGEVLEQVGLATAARQRIGTLSLGMGQRLGVAAALLGDPGTVILDEPTNGLDPEGVSWIRSLVRALASQGRAVLVSSHLISEVARVADHLVVLGAGRVVADAPLRAVLDEWSTPTVRVRAEGLRELLGRLGAAGAAITRTGSETAELTGVSADDVARTAAACAVVLTELTILEPSLEQAFFGMTSDSARYTAQDPAKQTTQRAAQLAGAGQEAGR